MSFYITTPIYYVNDRPHIGHAYTTVVADVLSRYHRLFGEPTHFLTGTDEHGQKVQEAAEKLQRTPQEHCDELVKHFLEAWKELEIKHDDFIRTTEPRHTKVVQGILARLHESQDIYVQDYEGWYSVSEERFYTEKELIDGKSPQGNSVQKVTERNYFFRMSKYQERLVAYITQHPEFIAPEVRRNEVLGFLRQPLGDLCISRPKSRLTWGIELPFDRDFVTYVWFDALTNYLSALGFDPKGDHDQSLMETYWKSAIHLIGKDILVFHAVYWPTMLMAMGVPLPNKIFAHGWWLTDSNEKMSKSKGPVVRPLDMKDVVGVDGLRYFLCRDITLGSDAQFSGELVVSRVNTDLANNLGNLLSRTTQLILKYFDGRVPKLLVQGAESQQLQSKVADLAPKVESSIRKLELNAGLIEIFDVLTEANKYLENQAPWKVAKDNLSAAGETLSVAVETLRVCCILLSPVMPEKMRIALEALGQDSASKLSAAKWGLLKEGAPVIKGTPLFPRIEANHATSTKST